MSIRTKLPCSCACVTTDVCKREAFLLVHLQAQLRQLHGNVGIDLLSMKFVQQRSVAFRCCASLIETVNIFAEDIHRGPKALCIQVTRDANRVRHGFARDVTLCHAAHDSFWNYRVRNQQLLDQQGALGVYCKSPMIKRIGAWYFHSQFCCSPGRPVRIGFPRSMRNSPSHVWLSTSLDGPGALQSRGPAPVGTRLSQVRRTFSWRWWAR